jgi:carboxymethylenebutenolidase
VVLQEWWGVDYEIKNHANHISQLGGGYRALIPEYDLVFCCILFFDFPEMPTAVLLHRQGLFYAIVFFVSLYRGKVALDVAEAQHLMDGPGWQGAVKDIQASVKWLKSNGSPKVGGLFICLV